jgi:hypothetical protein
MRWERHGVAAPLHESEHSVGGRVAERGFAAGIRIDRRVREAGDFENWHWPAPAEIQEALRRELMSRLADGANFEHASRIAATAEVLVGRDRTTARLVLPTMLGPALLTVMRPREKWLRAGESSSPVTVR